MSMADWFHAIQMSGFATSLRESNYAYPIVMTLHLASIAFFGGLLVMTDLRILGLAMTRHSVTDVVRQLRAWKWAGFVLIIACGLSLGAAKADSYYPNPYFRMKMSFLVLVGLNALIFWKSVYGNTEALDRAPRMPGSAKLAACISLLLWTGILCCGRWIAYYEPKKETKPQAAYAKPYAIEAARR